MEMRLLLESAEHEQVIFCRDRGTGLEAVIALHDLSRGVAMGGTRLRPYPSVLGAAHDALSLSRHMSFKARCARLPIGGAKGVIVADPKAKTPELLASYARCVERLGGQFVTGQDMNLTRADVDFLRGRTSHIAGDKPGTTGPALMTALGVFAAIKAALAFRLGSDKIDGRTFAVLGAGATGQELCRLLSLAGGHVLVHDLDAARSHRMADLYGATVVDSSTILRRPADVLSPCAGGQVIGAGIIPELGAKVIAGSANNQLVREDSDAELLKARGILYCPDFVVNAGGLIEVYHERTGYDTAAVLEHVQGIGATLAELLRQADAERLTVLAAAKRLAEDQKRQSMALPWKPDANANKSSTSPRAIRASFLT